MATNGTLSGGIGSGGGGNPFPPFPADPPASSGINAWTNTTTGQVKVRVGTNVVALDTAEDTITDSFGNTTIDDI